VTSAGALPKPPLSAPTQGPSRSSVTSRPRGGQSKGREPSGTPARGPDGGAPTAEELAAIAADLAQAAEQLAETADALVAAPAAERPALRATLHRWQTLLRLGARRLAQVGPAG
jgi:hypothetical protein